MPLTRLLGKLKKIMSNIKKSIVFGLVFGGILSVYVAIRYDRYFALYIGSISTITLSIISYFKIFSKVETSLGDFKKLDKESIIYSGLANHFKDRMSVGGRLSLTKKQLIFQTNIINFMKRHEYVIDLTQIDEVAFLDTFGFISNGLLVRTNDGTTEEFVVNGRQAWKEKIEHAIADLRV